MSLWTPPRFEIVKRLPPPPGYAEREAMSFLPGMAPGASFSDTSVYGYPFSAARGMLSGYSVSRKVVSGYSSSWYNLTTGKVDTLYDQFVYNNFSQATSTYRPVIQNKGPRGRPALYFSGTTWLEQAANYVSWWWGTVGSYLILSLMIESVATNDATVYNNDGVVADTKDFCGLYLRNNGPNAYSYVYPSAVKTASAAVVVGKPYVLEYWQSGTGGVVGLSINGVETTTSSDPTVDMSGFLYIGSGAHQCFRGWIFELGLADAVPSAANRAAMRANLLAWIT